MKELIGGIISFCNELGNIFDDTKYEVIVYEKTKNISRKTLYKLGKVDVITVIGLQDDISSETIEVLMSYGLPFSIVVGSDVKSLTTNCARILGNNRIILNNIALNDYYASSSEKSCIEEKDGLFLAGHGDYMCFNMLEGILCGKGNYYIGEKSKNVPNCVWNEECYRFKRLNDKKAQILPVNDIKAKVIFLNTCAGLSFADRKYMDYEGGLCIEALNNRCQIYISNYLIGNYSFDEVKLFVSVLSYFENIALSVFVFNSIVREYLHKKASLVCVGNSLCRVEINRLAASSLLQYTIVEQNRDLIILRVIANDNKRIHILKIGKNRFPNLDLERTVIVDVSAKCDICIGVLKSSEYILFFYSNSVIDTEILFIPEEKYISKTVKIVNSLTEAKMIYDILLDQEFLEVNSKFIDFMIKEIENESRQDFSNKLNIEYYTYKFKLLEKADKYVMSFPERLMRALIEYSMHTDSHLFLNSGNLISRSLKKTAKCPYCNRQIGIMKFVGKHSNRKYYQKICPKCEIFEITSSMKRSIVCNIEKDETDYIKLTYDVKGEFSNILLGVVVLNTNITRIYTFSDEKELNCNTIEINLTEELIKRNGLQYIRSVIISNYDIYVINRHLFL